MIDADGQATIEIVAEPIYASSNPEEFERSLRVE